MVNWFRRHPGIFFLCLIWFGCTALAGVSVWMVLRYLEGVDSIKSVQAAVLICVVLAYAGLACGMTKLMHTHDKHRRELQSFRDIEDNRDP